jgi:hypothetical protein
MKTKTLILTVVLFSIFKISSFAQQKIIQLYSGNKLKETNKLPGSEILMDCLQKSVSYLTHLSQKGTENGTAVIIF